MELRKGRNRADRRKMMKKWKKPLAVLCALTLAIGLFATGCTPTTPPDEGNTDPSATQNPPQGGGDDQTVTPPKDDEPPVTPPKEDDETPVTPPVDVQPSTMPRIDINTDNGSNSFATDYGLGNKPSIEYVASKVSVSNCGEDYALEDIACQVKARGNYTLNYDKKPIRLKFDKKQKMLGLNGGEKFKSWVLLADYKDDSMLRNSTALYLSKYILGTDGYYSSDYCDVELYINGQYWGVYLLVEQQQVNKNRVNITEPEDADGNEYTGTDIGYFVEYDGYFNAEAPLEKFTIDYNNFATLTRLNGSTFQPDRRAAPAGNEASDHIIGYSISSDIYSQEQNNFIASYIGNAYKLCYEAIYRHNYLAFDDTYTTLVKSSATTAESCISAAVDIDSMVDSYIIQEITCDSDVSWSSFYMDVDFGAKGDKLLRFEAPWDFDSALGNRNACENSTGMYAANSNNPWLVMFASQDWFNNKVKARWQRADDAGVFDGALQQIDDVTAKYAQNFAENIKRWGYMNVRGELCWAAQQCSNQAESAAYLKSWLSKRFDYLGYAWGAPDSDEEDDVQGTAYRFEAENCSLTGGIQIKQGNGASGNGYLGNVSGGTGKTMSFTVTAQSATRASLYIGLSKRSFEASLAGWFTLTVNGKAVTIPYGRMVPSTSTNEWHDWTAVKMADITLTAGANTVVVTTASGDTTNVDYFELISPVTLNR